MKKSIITFIFLVGIVFQTQAQNKLKKWYISTGAHAINHVSVRGLFDGYFDTDNWSMIPPISQLSIARHLNNSFAVDVQASIGEIDQLRLGIDDEFIVNAGAGLRYKFANDYILGINSWFDPYLRLGVNYHSLPYEPMLFSGDMVIDTSGEALNNGYEIEGPGGFLAISGGAGINFWIWPKIGLNIESQYFHIPEVEADYLDFFQFKAGVAFRFGKNDRDGDGIYDEDDECVDTPGLPEFNGCPDTDGDGFPDMAGDNNMFADKVDECVEVPGIEEFNGCPDTDGDGYPDLAGDNEKYIGIVDACPEEACPKGEETDEYYCEQGCKVKKDKPVDPVIPPDPVDPPVVELEFIDVQFEFDKSTIKGQSITTLEEAAEVIKENKGLYYVDGHTDNYGPDEYNMNLSRRRAEAVKAKLLELGVDESDIDVRAFGESQPKCTNDTSAGRRCNRRVVISVKEDGDVQVEIQIVK